MQVFKVQNKVCSERFWCSKFLKLIKTLFTILWYMHTNQQKINKNYLNQIKEFFLPSRVDNSRSFYFYFSLFSIIFQVVPLHYRVVWAYRLTNVLFLELLIFSTHEIKRVRWRQKKLNSFSLFFFSNFLSPLDS